MSILLLHNLQLLALFSICSFSNLFLCYSCKHGWQIHIQTPQTSLLSLSPHKIQVNPIQNHLIPVGSNWRPVFCLKPCTNNNKNTFISITNYKNKMISKVRLCVSLQNKTVSLLFVVYLDLSHLIELMNCR